MLLIFIDVLLLTCSGKTNLMGIKKLMFHLNTLGPQVQMDVLGLEALL